MLRPCGAEWIALVADGLGGHPRGDEASQTAVCAMTECLTRCQARASFDPDSSLRESLSQANLKVLALDDKAPPWGRRPSTTLVGGLFRAAEASAHLCNVGDSLAFILRDGSLQWLFLPQGRNNIVDFALGFDLGPGNAAVDWRTMDLRVGDRILLSSDGLAAVGLKCIEEALNLATARGSCERLLERVVDLGDAHQDNCTVLVLSVGSSA